VMIVNSETEALPTFPVRQPDSEFFRYWEVAGVAHTGGTASAESSRRQMERDGLGDAGSEARAAATPSDPAVLPFAPVDRAAIRHLQTSLTTGTPAPSQPRIEINPGSPPEIRRDKWGNAIGGIRLPDMEVPVAAHAGTRAEGFPFALFGQTRPFTVEQLRELYPSRRDYLQAYEQAAARATSERVLLTENATDMLAEAEKKAADLITW
jgi:hypothetical protein